MLRHMAEQQPVPEWTLGNRCYRAREYADLTQTELADRMGVHRQTVGHYEAMTVKPRAIVLKAWARECGVDEDWLIGDSLDPPPPVILVMETSAL